MLKLWNQSYQSDPVGEIGSQWGNFSPETCDLKVPEEPLQLRRWGYTADTNANIARGAQHAKEMEWGEERRTGKVPWRGGEGSGTGLWVCLVPVTSKRCGA